MEVLVCLVLQIRMQKTTFFSFCLLLSLSLAAQSALDSLPISKLQFIASHNSYRIRTFRPILNWTKVMRPFIPKAYDSRAWDYSHLPLEEQFDRYGVRGIELDVYYDPEGGRYAKRRGNLLVFRSAKSKQPALYKPGFKLIHIPEIDYQTHYLTFVEALQALKKWSDTHPQHEPVFVQVEIKNAALGDYIKWKYLPKAIPFSPQAADALDAEVRTVFGEGLGQVVTPDKLRGDYATLPEAVRAGNMPTLAGARGKIFFMVDGCEEIYGQGHFALRQRTMFTYAKPRSPDCAFIIANDALRQQDSIRQWVSEGYMVRTRCDADTYEARKGDYSRQQAAFGSGAQILSTDYYRADPRHKKSKRWSDYVTAFPAKAVVRRGGE